MAATGGRITCRRCGANNFDTQAACWKCNSPLSAAASGSAYAASPAPNSPIAPPSAAPVGSAPVYRPAVPENRPDPAVAVWSAVALAIIFPYIAVPVGIVFLMLDDRRKLEIGRITLIWGIIATIVHTLITGWIIGATIQQGVGMIQGIAKMRAAASGEGGDGGFSIPGLSGGATGGQRFPISVPSAPSYENVPFPEVPNNANSSQQP